MDTKDRKILAIDFFKEGYNCAQAVLLAFSDMTGLDESMSAKIAAPFGGGMGRMREVCGAVSGMLMVLGCLDGYDEPKNAAKKKALYEKVQQMADEFKEETGSIICAELLGGAGMDDEPKPAERNEAYYKKRPCAELVGIAAEIADRHMSALAL